MPIIPLPLEEDGVYECPECGEEFEADEVGVLPEYCPGCAKKISWDESQLT